MRSATGLGPAAAGACCRMGADPIIKAVRQRWPFLKRLFAGGAYDRGRPMSLAAYRDFVMEIVRKLSAQQALSREHAAGWLSKRSGE